jgi:hypothetical protein
MTAATETNLYGRIRLGAAVLLCGAAVWHAVLAARGGGSALGHGLFVALNLALAALLVLRPRWAYWPSIALGAHQMWSHGLDLSRSFLGDAPLDWASLAVCLFFPTLVTILFVERQDADAVAG